MRIARNLAVSVCAVAAVASLPARSMTLRDTEVVCPIDGKKFKALLAFSGTQFGMHLDLKPVGPTPAPSPLAKCPGNGFVIYKQDFSQDELKRLRSYVRSGEYQALAKVHTNYFLAAKLKTLMGEPATSIANTLLQSTWEARNPEEYRAYAIAALASYEKVLLDQPQDEEESLTATLVAGELERRLGLFERSRSRFQRIPNRDSLRPPMDQIVKLQLTLIERKSKDTAEVPVK